MLKTNTHLITIGIDRNLHKFGVAVCDTETKSWLLHKAIPYEDIIETLTNIYPLEQSKINLGADWLNKRANFLDSSYPTAQAKARKVGENAAMGKILISESDSTGQYRLSQNIPKGTDSAWFFLKNNKNVKTTFSESDIHEPPNYKVYVEKDGNYELLTGDVF